MQVKRTVEEIESYVDEAIKFMEGLKNSPCIIEELNVANKIAIMKFTDLKDFINGGNFRTPDFWRWAQRCK